MYTILSLTFLRSNLLQLHTLPLLPLPLLQHDPLRTLTLQLFISLLVILDPFDEHFLRAQDFNRPEKHVFEFAHCGDGLFWLFGCVFFFLCLLFHKRFQGQFLLEMN